MLKIVHIVSSFKLGGVQTGILYSIEELNKKFDYKVITYDADNDWIKDFPEEVKKNIIILNSPNLIVGSVKAFKLLQKMKPDIIISSLWKSVPVTALYRTLYSKVGLCGFYYCDTTVHFADTFFLWLLGKRLDIAFSDSDATKKFIEKKLSIYNSIVISCIFDFKTSPKTRIFNPQEIKMAYFGRLVKIKRIDRAITFCYLCKKEGIYLSFDIYGEGDTEAYNALIEKYGLSNQIKIKTLLPLNKVQPAMQEYDFLLQLSDAEGMALSVAEALSSGLVPLVTPVGEITSYTKDGINAIWLDTPFDENLPSLVKKLLPVISNAELYANLSIAASMTFKNQRKYSESFAGGINDFIKKR